MEKEQIRKLINRKIDFHDMTKARMILNKSYIIESGKMESADIKIALQKGSPVAINNHIIIGYDPLRKAFIDSKDQLLQIERPIEAITVKSELPDTRQNFVIMGRIEWLDDISEFNNIIGSLKIGEVFLPKHSAVFNFLNHTDETRSEKIQSVLDGINIHVYDSDNYVDNCLHEIGHLFWRTCLTYDERMQFDELFKYLKPSAIYAYSWERSDSQEVFCTIYKWYLKSILMNRSFLTILEHEEPDGYRLLQQIFERIAKSRLIDDIWELSQRDINDYLFPKIDRATGVAFRKKGLLESIKDIELPNDVLSDIDSVQDGVTYVNFGKAVLPVKGNKIHYEVLAKAGKDVSKLHKKMITDKRGIVRTVWVKGLETEKKHEVTSSHSDLVTFKSVSMDQDGFEKLILISGNKEVATIQGTKKNQSTHRTWFDYKAFRVAEITATKSFLESGKFEKSIQSFADRYDKGLVLDEDLLDPEVVKHIKKMDHMVTDGGGFIRIYPTGYKIPEQDSVVEPEPYKEPEREVIFNKDDVVIEKSQVTTGSTTSDVFYISYKGEPAGGFLGKDEGDSYLVNRIDLNFNLRSSGLTTTAIQSIADRFEKGLKLEIYGTGITQDTRIAIESMKNYDAEADINGYTYIRREKKSDTDFSQSLMFFEKAKKNNTPQNPDIEKALDIGLSKFTEDFRDHLEVDNDTSTPFHFLDKKEKARIINKTRERLTRKLKQLQDVVEKNPIIIRAERSDLISIIKSGELKNQWETGTSNGSLSKDNQTRWEKQIIKNGSDEPFDNIEYKNDAPANVKPIYGYVGFPEAGERLDRRVSQYGDIKIILKPEVSERATYTLGDSSNTTGAFTKGGISKILEVSNKFRQENLLHNLDNIDTVLQGGTYLESQIFGGVNIQTDVQEIVVTEQAVWDIENFKQEHGLQNVNVRYYTDGDIY